MTLAFSTTLIGLFFLAVIILQPCHRRARHDVRHRNPSARFVFAALIRVWHPT
jgi:hypothetical protein